MPKSVNIGHIHLNTKIYCMCVVGGSPPVDLVILGTDWCQCADTDKELHLSFTDELILGMPAYIDFGLHTSC